MPGLSVESESDPKRQFGYLAKASQFQGHCMGYPEGH
jgi:hypothetical protein